MDGQQLLRPRIGQLAMSMGPPAVRRLSHYKTAPLPFHQDLDHRLRRHKSEACKCVRHPCIRMPDIKTGRTRNAGSLSLYYTVRGAGPALLILQGGAGNADSSELLANKLADRFTVITYDRRGLSRSTPVQQQDYEIATHADDAAQVIAALSSGPACVFGSSMGALLGLELALRHPASVRNVIAHEPPAYRLLEGKEREEALLSHLALQETFRKEGLPAAMKLMMARSGVDFNDREPDIPAPQPQPIPRPPRNA